ncbi:unnamed protein product [Musa textilis]
MTDFSGSAAPAKVIFGKYELGRLLGRGASAKVYHARHVSSGPRRHHQGLCQPSPPRRRRLIHPRDLSPPPAPAPLHRPRPRAACLPLQSVPRPRARQRRRALFPCRGPRPPSGGPLPPNLPPAHLRRRLLPFPSRLPPGP